MSFFKGRASYLSANVCNEFIEIIGKQTFAVVLAELKAARYHSLSVDSTPDVSHTDQLAFCVRYVKDEGPVERFLKFIPIVHHTSEYLCGIVMEFLEKYGVSLLDCRGQSYDNANNMAGAYSGLQARILNENDLAKFLPCAAHSLCLVGKNSVSKVKKATEFFTFIENLYLFFVRSPYRWQQLIDVLDKEKDEVVLKRATGTRWSAKHSAVKALHLSYPKIKKLLISFLSDDCALSEDNKLTAEGLLKKLCKFETIFLLKLWQKVLSQFDKVNISLQKTGLDLSLTIQQFGSLVRFLDMLKAEFDTLFVDCTLYFEENVTSDPSLEKIVMSKTRSQNNFNVENKESFQNEVFLPVITNLLAEIDTRKKVYNDLYFNFDFLVQLNNLSLEQITVSCKNISSIYKTDVSEVELIDECEMAKHFFFFDDKTQSAVTQSHASLYTTIVKDKLATTFPNIEILLRIYLCFFVTNVTDERSFSKLKYIKNYLRNSMSEEKLNSLSLICIERNLVQSINFDDVIDTFISAKMRRMNIERS